MGVLDGVKVIEVAGIGPGPFAAMVLADMGADVLRVDRPAGGPRALQIGNPGKDVLARGRRSVALDLKSPEGLRGPARPRRRAPTCCSRATGPASPSGSASARTSATPATSASSTAA